MPEEDVKEVSSGRINFEQVLQGTLSNASRHYQDGEFARFARTIQDTWNNCLLADKDHILTLVERLAREGDNRRLKEVDQHTFLRYVEANPRQKDHLFKEETKIQVWRRIYEIMNQGLKERYFGKKRKWKSDELTRHGSR